MHLSWKSLLLGVGGISLLLGLGACVWYVTTPNLPPEPIDPVKEAELDPKKQKLLWDNEHMTFEIERRFGPFFVRAMLDRNTEKLQELLREGFRADVLVGDEPRTRRKVSVSETRKKRGSCPSESVDAEAFSENLLGLLAPVESVQRKTFRVLEIEQLPGENRWKTRLLIGFFGRGQGVPWTMTQSEHLVEWTIEDKLNLGTQPVIDRWEEQYETVRTSDKILMEEVTRSTGLDRVPLPDNWKDPPIVREYGFQVAVADFNRDGYLDLAVAIQHAECLLLESDKGERFVDVTQKRGVHSPEVVPHNFNYVATWFDYDNDGYPDLLLGERLYRNIEGVRFEDVTARSNLKLGKECMGCNVADFDNDGRLDLYLLYQTAQSGVLREKPRWVNEAESGAENQLWRNEGDGYFRNVTAASNAGGGKRHTHAASWFFYDEDHFPDLYIANDFSKNVILRNRGNGTFEDVSANSGADGFATSMGVVTGDVDNDERSDVYVANMYSKMGRRILGQLCDADYPKGIFPQLLGSCAGNRLYFRKTGEEYRDLSKEMEVNGVGWAYAPTMLDIDADGWLDLYATTGFMSFNRDEPDG